MVLPATLVFSPAAAEMIRAMEAIPLKVQCVRASVVHPTAPDNFFCIALRVLDMREAMEVMSDLAMRFDFNDLVDGAVITDAEGGGLLMVFPEMRGAVPVRH